MHVCCEIISFYDVKLDKFRQIKKVSLILSLFLCFRGFSQPILGQEKLESMSSSFDSLHTELKYGFLVTKADINGQMMSLIFDTGADVCLLKNDTIFEDMMVNVRTTGSDGSIVNNRMDLCRNFKFTSSTYSNINAIRVELPDPLECVSDGILGNNVIKLTNWIITGDKVVSTTERVYEKDVPSFDISYRNSNRLYSELEINGVMKMCLIDYGGQFELQLPESHMNDLTVKKELSKRIMASYSINGRSMDTIVYEYRDITIGGYAVDSVKVEFIENLSEPRLGVGFLSLFEKVTIDNKKMKLSFYNPGSHQHVREHHVTVDYINNKFVVSGRDLNDDRFEKLDDVSILSVDGRKASEFNSYCDFMDWYLKIRNRQVSIVYQNETVILD